MKSLEKLGIKTEREPRRGKEPLGEDGPTEKKYAKDALKASSEDY